MKIKRFLLVAVSWIVLSFVFINSALADFGNFDTYDSSGWDSGSWDSSSGWDSDWSSDWGSSGNYYFFSNYDDDYDSESDIPLLIVVVIIIFIIVLVYSKKAKNIGNTGRYGRNMPRRTATVINYPNKNSEAAALIRKNDTAFNSDKFIAFVNEAYVKLQAAWSKRDLEPIRLLLSEEMFAQTSAQAEEYKRLGRINRMERIAVQDSYITSYSADNEKETLTVYLFATQKDYIIDEKTNSVLEGSSEQYRHSKYIITFIRAMGKLTENNSGIETTNCPNCGAPLEITASGKCAYCDSVITNEDHSWVIASMKRVN